MGTSQTSVFPKVILLFFVFIATVVFALQTTLTPSIARSQQERVLDNAISENVPVKIKIKKNNEAAFKDLRNDKWLREFELELTNVGNKPIFFVYLNLVTDVKLDNRPLIFPLMYGRAELGDIVTKAGPEDVPIKPGETYIFKIHPGQIPAWERGVTTGKHLDAVRIKASIQMLSFGDGTGFFVNKPYPKPVNNQPGIQAKSWPQTNPKSRGKPIGRHAYQFQTSVEVPTLFSSAIFLIGIR